jgi:hypothetical protein
VTEENLRLVDVGTGSNTVVRTKDPALEASSASASANRAPQGSPAQAKDQKNSRTGTALPAASPAPPRGPLPSKDPADTKADAITPTAAVSPPAGPVQSNLSNSKVEAATPTAQFPLPNGADQVLQAQASQSKDPHTKNEMLPPAAGPSRPSAQPKPASQAARVAASADPCPYGQHLVDWKDGVANCAFD